VNIELCFVAYKLFRIDKEVDNNSGRRKGTSD